METDVQAFLEHHGVKGMKWGVRGTRRAQKRLDRTSRIAEGKASFKDRALGSAITRKGAQRQLQRGANMQAKMNAGKYRVSNRLNIIGGVRVKELNFHAKGDANAKRDTRQRVALAAVGVLLVAHGANTLKSLG